MQSNNFIVEMLSLHSENLFPNVLGGIDMWFKTDTGAVKFLLNCNDLFAWGTADAEEVEPCDFDNLKEAISDIKHLVEINNFQEEMLIGWLSSDLFACRKRKMRPQKPWYKNVPEKFHNIFNECGPER